MSSPTLPATAKTRSVSSWTPERRRAQAEAIRRWRPWTRSTGPRTAAGKARAAQNAYKHGQRSRAHQSLAAALRGQRLFVREMRVYARDKRNFPANELLNARAAALRAEGWNVLKSLALALAADQIMQKPCFLGPPAANS